MKPDVAFFKEVAQRLDIKADDTVLYFDDTKACTDAAAQLGWQCVNYSELEHFSDHPLIRELIGT